MSANKKFQITYANSSKANSNPGYEINEDSSFEGALTEYIPKDAYVQMEIGNWDFKLELDRFGPTIFKNLKSVILLLWDEYKDIKTYSNFILFNEKKDFLHVFLLGEFVTLIPVFFLSRGIMRYEYLHGLYPKRIEAGWLLYLGVIQKKVCH